MPAVLALAFLQTACTSRQLYGTGQAWQRNECYKLPDSTQRERCLASTAKTFEEYQRELR